MDIDADLERLGDIGDRILAGEPFEGFDLTSIERDFVLAYTRRGVEQYLALTGGEDA